RIQTEKGRNGVPVKIRRKRRPLEYAIDNLETALVGRRLVIGSEGQLIKRLRQRSGIPGVVFPAKDVTFPRLFNEEGRIGDVASDFQLVLVVTKARNIDLEQTDACVRWLLDDRA